MSTDEWFGGGTRDQIVEIAALSVAVTLLYLVIALLLPPIRVLDGGLSIHPVVAVPVATGLLFGSVAIAGAVLGSILATIAEGSVDPSLFAAIVGTFLLGAVPWLLRGRLVLVSNDGSQASQSGVLSVELIVLGVDAAVASAVVTAWWLDLLGAGQFFVLAPRFTVETTIAIVAFTPPLLWVLTLVRKRTTQIPISSPAGSRPDETSRAWTLVALVPVGWLLIGTAVSLWFNIIPRVADIAFWRRGLGAIAAIKAASLDVGESVVQLVIGSVVVTVWILVIAAAARRTAEGTTPSGGYPREDR